MNSKVKIPRSKFHLGFWILGFGLLLLPFASAKEYKVGYVNSDEIIARYEGAIEAKKQLDAEIAKFEAKAESLKMEYEQAKEEYESQQLGLSEEGKRTKLAEVESRKRRYDNYLKEVYGKNGKIEQKNQELIAPIVAQIDSAVRSVAEEEGFSLVIDAAKAGVVYAALGLDLTQLVVEELNRRYAPAPPIGPTKLIYAIMPIYETNDEAQQAQIGKSIRTFVNDLIGNKPQVEVLPNPQVDEIIQSRGYASSPIQLTQALDVAQALNADYCIFGECSKKERRIQFKLSLVDVKKQTLVKSQSGETESLERLKERVSAVVQVLYSSIKR